MMKFACFERTVEALYKYVVPKPRDQCTKSEQLTVTFAAGYIAGVFCAVVSHPADTVVSKLNNEKGSTALEVAKRLGFAGMCNLDDFNQLIEESINSYSCTFRLMERFSTTYYHGRYINCITMVHL